MATPQLVMQKAGYLEAEALHLIARAQSGDQTAFEAIYRTHLGRVYAICLRILADRSRAEEMTQKIFIRAWIKLNSFRGDSRFSTWLYRLSVNVILGELKSERAKDIQTARQDEAPASAIIKFESLRNLRLDLDRAIAMLPQQARIIFVLHEIEGFTHDEIADVMGLAVGTCKAQLNRARGILREVIKQ
jgi:RNA polymerase sigma-70 factor (ECF subfamily)